MQQEFSWQKANYAATVKQKKPKQPKKPFVPATPFSTVQSRVRNDGLDKRKS